MTVKKTTRHIDTYEMCTEGLTVEAEISDGVLLHAAFRTYGQNQYLPEKVQQLRALAEALLVICSNAEEKA